MPDKINKKTAGARLKRVNDKKITYCIHLANTMVDLSYAVVILVHGKDGKHRPNVFQFGYIAVDVMESGGQIH